MKELFSVSDAAKVLKISRVAVLKKIKLGHIKAEKVGRNFIIEKEEVMKQLGLAIGERRKKEIEYLVKRSVKQYGDVFKKLGKEWEE